MWEGYKLEVRRNKMFRKTHGHGNDEPSSNLGNNKAIHSVVHTPYIIKVR